MAQVVVTIKIMPKSPDVDLKIIEEKAKEEITKFGGDTGKVEIEPIAFGLKAVNLIFVMDESIGNIDPLESKISEIDGVQSAEVTDVRRALG
ncbi:MAG: elongation factor 1-beta [Nanoarchaeota archaeon]|nr:elongation factor 1-beta [Nanoarchaeota archaeon]MBU0962561.1 elongation factor 1-beta [Nanoarchaeota archaeon]